MVFGFLASEGERAGYLPLDGEHFSTEFTQITPMSVE